MTRRRPDHVVVMRDVAGPADDARLYRTMRTLARILIDREDAGARPENGPGLDPDQAAAHHPPTLSRHRT